MRGSEADTRSDAFRWRILSGIRRVGTERLAILQCDLGVFGLDAVLIAMTMVSRYLAYGNKEWTCTRFQRNPRHVTMGMLPPIPFMYHIR
jgi:hypothetical protein